MGVKGIIEGTREVYPNGYRVVYEVTDNSIYIITIMHHSKIYP
ncbi:type II toxin-antitoxin system RelE/ParE family toxin [Testudinibacter sp. TR-2022]|nr:type II toxin-antitoxin system RelE/ParE family toxin [Testudinibacter sp. TR-2022]